MHVCHVTPAYPDDVHDHREGQNYRRLCQHLSSIGTTCSVVTSRQYQDSSQESNEEGIHVRRFVFGEVNARLGELRLSPWTAFRYLRAGLQALEQEHARQPFHVLHAHMPVPCGLLAVLAGRRLKVPVVLTSHGSDLLLYPQRSAVIRMVTQWVLKRVQAVTVVSQKLADVASRLAPNLQLSVIPIGYDGTVFTPGLPAEKRELQVVSTRNLAPLYRIDTLVEAANKLTDAERVKIIVYGEGPEREHLERLAMEAPVEFRGFANSASIADVLRRSAVYVSTAESDGTSVSLLEALATGSYPVVTDIPANREWVAHADEGTLVPVGDADALVGAIRDAFDDIPRRERAGLTNPGRVAAAAWDAIAPQYAAIYAMVTE